MIRKLSLIAIAAAALAACNNETIVANEQPDPMADELANAAPVELPPAIAASKTYRCKDNSLVRIDWLHGGKGAYVHGDGQAQTHVKPAEAVEGQPASTDLVAEGGFVLKGDATASSVTRDPARQGRAGLSRLVLDSESEAHRWAARESPAAGPFSNCLGRLQRLLSASS